MGIDRDKALALQFPTLDFDVERGRLAFFARSIGEDDPVYTSLEGARAAGHPDVPVPPTFFFSMPLEQDDPFWFIEALDIDLRRVLHGKQAFTYHSLAYAGDRLTLHARISDVYEKQGGAMELFHWDTDVLRGEELVAEVRNVIIVRGANAA